MRVSVAITLVGLSLCLCLSCLLYLRLLWLAPSVSSIACFVYIYYAFTLFASFIACLLCLCCVCSVFASFVACLIYLCLVRVFLACLLCICLVCIFYDLSAMSALFVSAMPASHPCFLWFVSYACSLFASFVAHLHFLLYLHLRLRFFVARSVYVCYGEFAFC